MIYFTSDLHIGHANIIKLDGRPFETIQEMDKEIIRRWNNKVDEEDTVYILGDILWKSKNNEAYDIINSLHGKKILIIGNHDSFLLKNKKALSLFESVKDYDDIVIELNDGTIKRCILSHYFIPMYDGHFYGTIHLHGHSHVSKEADIELEIAQKLNESGFPNKIYNVGCMYWNYEPVTLDEILKKENLKMLE